MSNPSIAKLNVKYDEYGQAKNREIKFKGNFGFNLDGQKYTVQNGQVLDANGKVVSEIDLARGLAYQLIGMSNTHDSNTTDDSIRDYTYTKEDITQAYRYQQQKIVGYDNYTQLDNCARTKIGYGAGDVTYAKVVDGTYTTDYKHKDYENITTRVSIWMKE